MGYKEDFKDMVPNLLAVTGVIGLLMLFPSGWLWFVLAVNIPFITKDIILLKSFKQLFTKQSAVNILKTSIISSLFYWLLRLLGRYGWVGFVITILGFSGYKLIMGRSYYMAKVREIEILIWGRTNDRKKRK